jgi:dCMP deaminase
MYTKGILSLLMTQQTNWKDVNKWYKRYLHLAKEVSLWSKDPNTKVGAIVVGTKGQILSQGYNGFPRGIKDTTKRLNDRDIKLSLVVHAEMNAIYNASYSGVSLAGATMFIHGLPACSECAKGIIQVGISKVIVSKQCIEARPHWNESWKQSIAMFEEAGVKMFIVNEE